MKWVKTNRFEALLIAMILFAGAFLRLYRINEYMTFLGDEGRDVIVVRKLLVDFDPILVGPGTSIGDMYLGPLYYYMMAPALLLANFSPVGPAVMVALLGLATVFFVWYVTREWFGKLAAFLASLLYATAPIVIVYSHSSWNPNIMPFFALLCIYSVWRIWRFNELKWLIILGVSYSFVLQSHYLGLLLAPVIGVFWFLAFLHLRKTKNTKYFIQNTIYSTLIFLLLMSPLALFDARHGWRNFSAVKRFFFERQTTVSIRPWTAVPKLWPIVEKINTRLLSGMYFLVGKFLSLFFALGITLLIVRLLKNVKLLHNKDIHAFLLLFVWLGVALVGLGLYKQEIYDHYYGFFFPAPFMLFGGLVTTLIGSAKEKIVLLHWLTYLIIFTAVIFLILLNIRFSPLRYPPNRQLQRTTEVAQKIVDESQSREFNLAVIAERNYEGAYQYFLEVWGAPLVKIDPQRAGDTITDQLFVICELPNFLCDPTHNPKAEIANFGWTKVENQWEVAGVTLYKLTHSQ